jgi:hypothetical protein
MHADNSGTLHDHIRLHTTQPIIWIANEPLASELRKQGIQVLVRNSLAARLAIFRAPVLIYSHGEDDLDQYAILWRNKLGYRVYLAHCLAHVKAGQFYTMGLEKLGFLRMAIFRWTMVDFDLLPASSELEKKHFALTLPHRQHCTHVGGGAHLDNFLRAAQVPTDGRIVWFPTFRDTLAEAKNLNLVIQSVISDPKILDWLQTTGRTLYVCHHINSQNHSSVIRLPQGAENHIRFCSPTTIPELLSKSDLFISDYSGLTADWLIMDRPAVFFPFDIDSYLKTRRIFIPYPEYHYGPWVKSAQELVDTLVSGKWMDLMPWQEKREHWKDLMFPHREPVYSRETLETIRSRHPLA